MIFLEKIKHDLNEQNLNREPCLKTLIDRAALTELIQQFERLNLELRESSQVSKLLYQKDEAIEHAKKLATASQEYLQVVNNVVAKEDRVDLCRNLMGKAYTDVLFKIYEFQKIAEL